MNMEKKQKRIDFSRVETWLVLTFIFYILFFLFFMKIMGASEIPKGIEKNGYCTIKFGEGWNYDEESLSCKNGIITKNFLNEDFEEVCPDQKFFSKGFNSHCFIEGRAW